MISILLNLIGLIQSIFLGSILVLSGSRSGKKHELYCGLLVLVFAIPIFNSIRILQWGGEFFDEYEILSNFSLLLAGPLLYLYTQSRLSNYSWKIQDGLHFLPFLLLFPLQALTYFFQLDSLALIVEEVAKISLVISMTAYQILSIRLLRRARTPKERSISFLIYGFALVWHINLLIQLTDFVGDSLKVEYRIFATLLLSALVLALCYIHWFELLGKRQTGKSKMSLSQDRAQLILQKINAEMANHQPYLQKDYSLQKLSDQIGEPASYISLVINQELQQSFPKYIAKLRIAAFVERTKNPAYQHLSIEGIWQQVGFRSSSTFNKAFKENMKMLPSEFIKSLRSS